MLTELKEHSKQLKKKNYVQESGDRNSNEQIQENLCSKRSKVKGKKKKSMKNF